MHGSLSEQSFGAMLAVFSFELLVVKLDIGGQFRMALLSQLVPASSLAKLSEAHISVLNAHLEHEVLTNASLKQHLGGKTQEILKQLGH